MKNKALSKKVLSLIPLVLSGLLCFVLIYLFYQKIQKEEAFILLLKDIAPIFIGLSISVSAIVFGYLVFTLYTKHIDKISSSNDFASLVKKRVYTSQKWRYFKWLRET